MGFNYQSRFICPLIHSYLQLWLRQFTYHARLLCFHEVLIRNDVIRCSCSLSSKIPVGSCAALGLPSFDLGLQLNSNRNLKNIYFSFRMQVTSLLF